MTRPSVTIFIDPLTLSESRICTKCELIKELEEFYSRYGGNKIVYSSWCKSCVKEYRQGRQDRRIHVNPKTGLEEIVCPGCKVSKILKDYYSENYVYSKVCKRCTCLAGIAA